MFDCKVLKSILEMRMNNFHSSHLLGKDFIPILISGMNPKLPKSYKYSSLKFKFHFD